MTFGLRQKVEARKRSARELERRLAEEEKSDGLPFDIPE